jgi:glycosyltransferase involved in cell wall biosynthesis
MKITFVLPAVNMHGGIRSTASLAEHLIKRGHEVLAVCPARRPPRLRRQVKSLLKGEGWVPYIKQQPSHFDHIDVPLKVLDRFRPITDADLPDADIVVATWWETAEWVAKLSERKGAKVYFIRHHEVHDYLPKQRAAATYRLPLHKVTISQWLVDLMRTEYGDSQVSLVPNSVNPKNFYAPPRGKQSPPTVGLLYSPLYWKGCDISIKAFNLAAHQVPNLKMIAFGFRSPTAELPLPPGTEFFQNPPQDKIKDIYASCDVWLCGSWSEGFHRPPLEAMACRCPVVSTQVGGPMDMIEQGVNGYLAPTGDYTALADYLVRVLTLSDEAWRTMSDAAYTRATAYTWDDAAELCEAAFNTAIERRQRGDFSSRDNAILEKVST